MKEMKEKKENSILELFKPYVPKAVTSSKLSGSGFTSSQNMIL